MSRRSRWSNDFLRTFNFIKQVEEMQTLSGLYWSAWENARWRNGRYSGSTTAGQGLYGGVHKGFGNQRSTCIISTDLVPKISIDQEIHDDYRNVTKISCRASGKFSVHWYILQEMMIVPSHHHFLGCLMRNRQIPNEPVLPTILDIRYAEKYDYNIDLLICTFYLQQTKLVIIGLRCGRGSQ